MRTLILLLLVQVTFFQNCSYAQEDSTLYNFIINNEVDSVRVYLGDMKAILDSDDEPDDDVAGQFFIDMILVMALPLEADRPDVFRVVLDSLEDMILDFDLMEEDFLMKGVIAASPGIIKYFLDEGFEFPADPIEYILDCENLIAEDVLYEKTEQDYIGTFVFLLQLGIELDTSENLLDYYFDHSNCSCAEIAKLIVENGGKGSPEALEKYEQMRIDEYALVEAIVSDNYTAFRALLEDDEIGLDEYVYEDKLLLEIAIQFDRPMMVRDLLEVGTNPLAVNPKTNTPALYALSIENSPKLVDIVLGELTPAQLNDTTYDGRNLLMKMTQEYERTYSYGSYLGTDEKKMNYLDVFNTLVQHNCGFNIKSRVYARHIKPFTKLHYHEPEDSLSIEIFKLFVIQTNQLENFSPGLFNSVFEINDTELTKIVVQKLSDHSSFLEVAIKAGKSDIVIDLIHELPEVIAREDVKDIVWMFAYSQPNAEQLAYLLDSTIRIGKHIPSVELDSFVVSIVNTYYSRPYDEQATVTYAITNSLLRNQHFNKMKYAEVLGVLLSHGASLKNGSITPYGTYSSIANILTDFKNFSYLYSMLHEALIPVLDFVDYNPANQSETDYNTGTTFRRSDVYWYEKNSLQDVMKKFCVKCGLKGPANVTSVNIPSDGKVIQGDILEGTVIQQGGVLNVPNFTRSVCSDDNLIHALTVVGATSFYISPLWSIRPIKIIENLTYTLDLSSRTNIENRNMSCSYSYTIDACNAHDSLVDCLPLIRIINPERSNGSVKITQNGDLTVIAPGKEAIYDRAIGNIELAYSGAGKDIDIPVIIDNNVTDVRLKDIVNRKGSGLSDRLYTYLKITDGLSDSSNTRSDFAMHRILSEYMLEKGYDRNTKESLDNVYNRILQNHVDVLRLYAFQQTLIRQQVGNQSDLLNLLRNARDNTADPVLKESITKAIDLLINDANLSMINLEVFTSSYFKQLTNNIKEFNRLLVEYSYFIEDQDELKNYTSHPSIQIIL
jgi:hypothetical protein